MNGEMEDEEWIMVGAFTPESKYRTQPLGWYVGRAVMTAARGARVGVEVTGVEAGRLVGELSDFSAAVFHGFGARVEFDRAQVEAVSLSRTEWLAGGPEGPDEEGEEEDAWPDGSADCESQHSGVGLAPGWMEQIAAAQQQRTRRLEGWTFERVRYGVEQGPGRARWPCPKCAVAEGQYHLEPCNVEHCPRCGSEGFRCDCHRDDDDLDSDDRPADAADA